MEKTCRSRLKINDHRDIPFTTKAGQIKPGLFYAYNLGDM
jgi:hypothetical protein